MSGPVSTDDAVASPAADVPAACEIDLIEGRATEVGGFAVSRLLPRRPRRTVGPWCFADHMGPGSVSAERGLDIGPHPHIGLQTVTWLADGAILHRDSLGSEQLIRPGQLNLMTAGRGVSHSEETAGVHTGQVHGIQFWVAQPDATRNGDPAFEHHVELPRVEVAHGVATVLVGRFLDQTSPARCDTPHVGVELQADRGQIDLALDPAFEYAVIVLAGSVNVGGCVVGPSALGYLGLGRDELRLDVVAPSTVMLIGGEPFVEPLLMWWNYVARTRDEVAEAHRAWTAGDDRFGRVESGLERISTADPPWA
jgi:redox-sensitive bicupin YhaK (pirin superfamily)